MDLTRQRDLIDTKILASTKVLMVGAGGIGSFAAFAMAKMGIENLQVWDKDTLTAHNIPNQNYYVHQVDMPKVDALRDIIRDATGTEIDTKFDFWYGDMSYDPDIIVSGVDSMTIRQNIWKEIKDHTKGLYIDARMASRSMSVFVVNFDNLESKKAYEETLFDSADAEKERCTAKSIIHTPFACAYTICQIIHDIIDQKPVYGSYHGQLSQFDLMKENTIVYPI